jgi:hypothetical protein
VNNSNIEISSNLENGANLTAGYNYVEIKYKSFSPLRAIQVLIGENMIQEIKIDAEKVGTFKGTINIPQ